MYYHLSAILSVTTVLCNIPHVITEQQIFCVILAFNIYIFNKIIYNINWTKQRRKAAGCHIYYNEKL